MKAIDTDPTFLRQLGETTAHSYDQSITHIEAEMKGVIPELMETLTEDGPYGYTITPEVLADGGVKLPVISTREGIEEAYKMIRGRSDLLAVNPLTEIRGTWYTFQDNISYGQLKGTDQRGAHETLGLFPSATGQGITGGVGVGTCPSFGPRWGRSSGRCPSRGDASARAGVPTTRSFPQGAPGG